MSAHERENRNRERKEENLIYQILMLIIYIIIMLIICLKCLLYIIFIIYIYKVKRVRMLLDKKNRWINRTDYIWSSNKAKCMREYDHDTRDFSYRRKINYSTNSVRTTI